MVAAAPADRTPTPKETDMRKMTTRKSGTVALTGNARRLWDQWCW
ncbi:hypothetical protein AB0O91_32555 [Kitasatospora sp. NPDC089797]